MNRCAYVRLSPIYLPSEAKNGQSFAKVKKND